MKRVALRDEPTAVPSGDDAAVRDHSVQQPVQMATPVLKCPSAEIAKADRACQPVEGCLTLASQQDARLQYRVGDGRDPLPRRQVIVALRESHENVVGRCNDLQPAAT